MSVTDFQEQPLKTLPDGCDTPYDFKLFVPDKFVDQTVETSRLYAARKANSHILPKLTHNNIRISHAIMCMTGYLTPSNMRMYWEKREDSRNNMVARTMSKATFTNIIRNTTFVKTTVADPKDRFWKVRPLFNLINDCAKIWVKHPKDVSIDEGMVKYFGPHPLKQFMRGKPHRFGYKIWIMTSSTGELLVCQPYGGASTLIADYGQGQGPNMVIGCQSSMDSFLDPRFTATTSSPAWTCWITWQTGSWRSLVTCARTGFMDFPCPPRRR